MGPQHPSTHGVLRIMIELEGETVLRSKPVIGYLHTGMEKTGEDLTYLQGPTNVTRMDYLAPLFNELVFSMATETLLGVDVPPRAQWIRMLMTELNRISSHVTYVATNGMDIAALSMMVYGFREREGVLAFFEKVTGLRMNHNYIRPGGVAADLPPGWRDDVLRILDDHAVLRQHVQLSGGGEIALGIRFAPLHIVGADEDRRRRPMLVVRSEEVAEVADASRGDPVPLVGGEPDRAPYPDEEHEG